MTSIVAVVSPVDHIRLEPVAVSTELPQLSETVTTGAEGTGNGLAVTTAASETQVPMVCVTEYVPEVTVILGVVAPFDHSRFEPVAVSVDVPQLSDTVTIGADGMVIGVAVPEPAALVHPPTVCVTV